MKWIDIFKKYNVQKMKKNNIVIFFVIISIILSVSISLAIPQVNCTLNKTWKSQAYKQNGADLKVEMGFNSKKFNEKIKNIKEIKDKKELLEFSATAKKSKKQTFSDVILGDYNLSSNEIILSNNVAKILKASIGDTIEVFDSKYKIKDIEEKTEAVGAQGEEMGYVKVSKAHIDKSKAYGKIVLIKSNNAEKVRKELKKAENKFTYTTVSDIEKEIDKKVDSNTMALSILNTMSIIMTIMSLISSIFLLITKSSKEIAIMKINSIECKKIEKAFRFQFYCYMLPAVLVGTFSSILLTKFILKMNNIVYKINDVNIRKIVMGAVLFIIIYMIYIIIASNLIRKIEPLTVIKVAGEKIKKRKIIFLSLLFTVVSLIIYAKYVGSSSIISGSSVMIALIVVFFIISFILISLLTLIKPRKVTNKYYMSHMREKKSSIVFTILSLSFTILFFLIGFTLSKTIGDSFTKGLRSKVNYNYMLTSDSSVNIENKLLQNSKTGKYTKLYRINALFYNKDSIDRVSNLCGIDDNSYKVKFKILKGSDVFEGNENEVLISSKMAKELNLKIGDFIKLNIKGIDYKYNIKGIYEAGIINTDDILIQKQSLSEDYNNVLYLANIKSDKVVESLTNISIVAIQNIGNSLENSMNNLLKMFKALCFICILASIIFNINIIYMNAIEDFRNFVVMRALSLGKKVLYKNVLTEMLVILIMTLIMSLGIYLLLMKLFIKMLFGVNIILKAKMIIMPIIISLIIIIVISIIPFSFVKKSSMFEILKELD